MKFGSDAEGVGSVDDILGLFAQASPDTGVISIINPNNETMHYYKGNPGR